MKTFKEHLAIIYDEHLIAEMSPKSNICDVPIGKLRSPLMKQMHKDKYGVSESHGWSENTARRLSLQERKEFSGYIKSQGFKFK